jgi:transglutaminase-like putative cysteine protease
MKRKLLIGLLAGFFISTYAQEYPVSAISDSLMKNADAVVRRFESVFEQTDTNNATHKVSEIITVLKESGKGHGNVVIYLDKFRDLKSFSGKITDASGRVIKRVGKNDLTTSAYSSHIASDDKYSYYEYQPARYPYTVQYEYEVKITNGIAHYPRFVPLTSYNLSVEQASYRIQVPSGMKIRYKAVRMPNGNPSESVVRANTVYEWLATNIPAVEREPYSPGLQDIIPMVYIAPNDFCMEGQCGNMSDWNNLGKWVEQLMTGRDVITPQLKEKMLALTADATDEKDKVQRIYKYLQSTTRYVSIQLGIGGYQPMSAADVEKTGFGDCKALSNYMKSLLAAVGINSIYTIISTDRANLHTDFADLGQMNHVILAVPLLSDTLWLECTSQILPFNYVHTNIAGHQCLLITPEGGKIYRVKKQSDIDDDRSRSITIHTDEEGNGKGHIKTRYRLDAYEGMANFVHSMSREEQINSLARSLQVAKVQISDLQIQSNDQENPDLQIEYDAQIERFANKSGSRLFVPFTLLQPVFVPINSMERKQDIMIHGGILRTDTIRINIPADYIPETMPQSTALSSVFGNYSVDIRWEENTLQIIQHVLIRKERYPASAIEEFRSFFKSMETEWNRRAVFRRNT